MYDWGVPEIIHTAHLVTWQAPEFEHQEKGISWYWLTIIAAVLLVALAVWQRNFLFGIFVVVAEVLVLLWGGKKPRTLTFSLNEKELIIGSRERYLWSEFLNFSIEERENFSLVVLQFKRLRPMLHILIPAAQFQEVKGIFFSRLPQVERERSLGEAVEEFFGL